MASLIDVAPVGSMPEGSSLRVDVAGTPVAVFCVGGTYYAIGDTCTHEEWSLSEGELVDDHTVECALHGAQFDLRTGQALCLPATINAEVYEVIIADGRIKIKVPDEP